MRAISPASTSSCSDVFASASSRTTSMQPHGQRPCWQYRIDAWPGDQAGADGIDSDSSAPNSIDSDLVKPITPHLEAA